MERLLKKYADKLVAHGLAEPGAPLVCGMDAELVTCRGGADVELLRPVFDRLNINSLSLCRPPEPLASVVDYLARRAHGSIVPTDSETRTFLHELPVAEERSAAAIVHALARHKCVILPGGEIVTYGTVSPEQAFVTHSSVCFASLVKFLADFLAMGRTGAATGPVAALARAVVASYKLPDRPAPKLLVGPFAGEEAIARALIEVGRLTVDWRLVDSFFGNVSYFSDGVIYISQTGSSLDELAGSIDPCPIDGSSSAGITASSELVAHRRIYGSTDVRAVLHGHPKFAVTLSLDCAEPSCPSRGRCHLECPRGRFIGDTPIIPGEVGAGPSGLCNTLPPAVAGRRAAIVYGHGLFVVDRVDFNAAFSAMVAIERACFDEYCRRADM